MSSLPPATIGPDLRTALIAMVRRRVPESEVEDIVQSTLADALQSPHAPKDSESLRRWIFGVAKNKVVDYHRRAKRESFEVPDVAGKPAPHLEADLLRWAEKNLPPGDENKTTLDWMLREGEGEKLEWIAETEKVPAPRVRQRVSRLRRHLKDHWRKEVALLATLGVLITIVALVIRGKEPEPIANENLPRAEELRKQAFERCAEASWEACVGKLDDAKRLDPAGDTRPEVRLARDNAQKALTLPPTPPSPSPTESVAPTPTAPTPTPPAPSGLPAPVPTGMKMNAPKTLPDMAPVKPQGKSVTPSPTEAPPAPSPPSKSGKPTGGTSSLGEFDPAKELASGESNVSPTSKSDAFTKSAVPSKRAASDVPRMPSKK